MAKKTVRFKSDGVVASGTTRTWTGNDRKESREATENDLDPETYLFIYTSVVSRIICAFTRTY